MLHCEPPSVPAQLCKVARAQEAAFVQCYLACPSEIAAARNAERPAASRVPDDAFGRMAQVPACLAAATNRLPQHLTAVLAVRCAS